MVRACQGIASSVPVGVDTAFAAHLMNCLAVGLPVGVYHAYIPHREGLEQAQFFLETTAPYRDKITLGYAIDAELDYDMDPDVITGRLYELTKAFEDALNAKPDIYTNLKFWTNSITPIYDTHFGTLRLWLAAWGATNPILPHGFKSIWLHQFTNEYALPAKNGGVMRVDMNRVLPVVSTKTFTLQLPVTPPGRITQAYGANYDYYMKEFGLPGHEGIDWGGKDGDPILSAQDGVVKLIAPDNGIHPYGAHVRITHTWHADTFETIYAHLRGFKAGLVQGETVHQGDVIGYMGSSGNSTGVHVHLSLKRNGVIVNPTPYFGTT